MAVWQDKFIKPNQYSRPQKKITAIRKIVIHWTANFGATANGHYNYFNTLKGRYASAHFFVDKNEALCIIPLNEIAYHANDGSYKGIAELKPNANFLSVGIEMCVEKDGSFHPDTIAGTIAVAVELCKRYKLDPMTDIVRHYDVTHKNCPAPWVKNSTPFNNFKKAVDSLVNKKVEAPKPVTPAPSKPVEKPKTHTVEEGETYYAIAKKYGMDVNVLMGYNPRVKASDLKVGDVIHLIPVPEVKPTPTPTPTKPVAEKAIGNVVIETASLNIRKDANLDASVVGQALKGAKFPVYEQKNGMLRIGVGKWISAHADYSKYTPNTVAPKPVAKPVLTYSRTLKSGMNGADVKALQTALNKLDFNCGTPDGDYGTKTVDAVKRFQKVYLPYEVDGIAGKKTIDKINSLLK